MLFQENKFSQKLFLDKSVLEIGCNQGLTTLQISKFAKKVTAIDNNKNHIYFAKKLSIKKKTNSLGSPAHRQKRLGSGRDTVSSSELLSNILIRKESHRTLSRNLVNILIGAGTDDIDLDLLI